MRSVITMAGDLSNARTTRLRDTGMPILHVMETNDEYDPYPHSIDWDRDNLTAPAVDAHAREREPRAAVHAAGQPLLRAVSAATVDFLDGTLKGHPERLDQTRRRRRRPPRLATWSAKTTNRRQLRGLYAVC